MTTCTESFLNLFKTVSNCSQEDITFNFTAGCRFPVCGYMCLQVQKNKPHIVMVVLYGKLKKTFGYAYAHGAMSEGCGRGKCRVSEDSLPQVYSSRYMCVHA